MLSGKFSVFNGLLRWALVNGGAEKGQPHKCTGVNSVLLSKVIAKENHASYSNEH